MKNIEIEEIINRETKAWNTQNIDLLLTIFHPDFVWVWPKNNHAHNPIDWEIGMGKFEYTRWKKEYQEFFSKHTLVHNKRNIIKIETGKDCGFAVVDIDTLWDGKDKRHWKGRVCKVYAKVNGEIKLTMHTGVLEY